MGAWAIVLARHCVTDFVTFGITLAGRSPSVPGVERMVGFFMNILPVAARIARDECYLPWAAQLQTLLLGVRPYEHLPATLPAIWCSRGLAPFLFDSLFVFENYPVQTPGEQLLPGVDLRETQGIVLGNFPLTVVVSKDGNGCRCSMTRRRWSTQRCRTCCGLSRAACGRWPHRRIATSAISRDRCSRLICRSPHADG